MERHAVRPTGSSGDDGVQQKLTTQLRKIAVLCRQLARTVEDQATGQWLNDMADELEKHAVAVEAHDKSGL